MVCLWVTLLQPVSPQLYENIPPAPIWNCRQQGLVCLGRPCTDHLGEAGDCGRANCLRSTPASLSLRPVSAMWLFQPANRRAFPIPAPGQVGGWGRKPAVLITFPPRERLSGCVGASANFKVNVEGPFVLAEGMTQPLGCGVCVK